MDYQSRNSGLWLKIWELIRQERKKLKFIKKYEIEKLLSTSKVLRKPTIPTKTMSNKTGAWLIDGVSNRSYYIESPILKNLKDGAYDISARLGDLLEDNNPKSEEDLWELFDEPPVELGDYSFYLIPDDVNRYASEYFKSLEW